ncbi:MBL fold metallo-hydrolase [Acaryochloris sp. IP29b_bin.148]|uniref:MBL fold metallo-hydrolase n=1 Tax=Acaryochloris sp. IP29b_bin.148 TaxID=2969218 RepID=UPI002610D912|nr:MBL fold metallo-hydrolase [Acaryochloris sp. IP29b_bin.148]
MNRRRFMHYVQAGLITSLGAGLATQWQSSPAQAAGSLSIRWLGHTCFLFSGSGVQVLVNPFRPVGCTANYPSPQTSANIVLISSRLLDEGVVEGLPGRPKLLFEPGAYKTNGLQFQGIRTLHDRVNGYRFGTNVAWKWVQGGVNVVHLGGIASPISVDQKILMGRPDVLLIPVGGSAKAYNPEEAKAAIQTLNPKMVIPTHYKTAAADESACDLQSVDAFLSLMQGTTIRRPGGSGITVSSSNLPSSGPIIQVLNY